eukprot:GILJ01003483.1.p1 GENE.GILJ01003483.1~~GILJ01003483.1.p1  ORF type:complete len:810 (+),score=205.76 GILJ01003483.1:57-2432(+)
MKVSELLAACQEIVSSFNPLQATVDSHAEQFVAEFENVSDAMFVKQVFYGCFRYKKFLKVFISALLYKFKGSTQRSDSNLFTIFAYLAIFRLDELGLDEFRRFVISQEPTKMQVFLSFLFNVDTLENWCREEWCKSYDHVYIDETIIGGIKKRIEDIQELLNEIDSKATGKKMETEKEAPQPTQFEPFNLTKPRPRLVPEPVPIPKGVKSRPVPSNLFNTTLQDIEKQKQKRREEVKQETKKKYAEEKEGRFNLRSESRPSKFAEVKAQVEKERQDQLKFDMKHTNPVPNFAATPAEVKLNVAAILREDAVYKKKQEQEAQIIKAYEEELRDTTEYERWQNDMRRADEEAKRELIEKRKLEMEMARQEAIEAFQQKIKENQLIATHMREMTKEQLEQAELEKIQEVQEKQKLVEMIVEQRQNIAVKKEEVILLNQKTREELKAEMAELIARKKAQDAIEQKEREELIRQIRALEKVPIARTKHFDPTVTPGHGLLEEMSLIELQERLAMNKVREAERVEEIRIRNLDRKNQFQEDIKEKIKSISRVRAAASKENASRRQQKVQQEEEQRKTVETIREKGLMEIQQKIIEKKQRRKAEEEKLARELKEIKLQRQFMSANQAAIEEKAWKQLELGAEREIKNRQEKRLLEQAKYEVVKATEQKIAVFNKKQAEAETAAFHSEYAKRVSAIQEDNEAVLREQRELKQAITRAQREHEVIQKKVVEKRQPYSTKMKEASLRRGKRVQKTTQMMSHSAGSQGEGSLDLAAAAYSSGDELMGEDMSFRPQTTTAVGV